MRTARVLAIALVIGASAVLPAAADPISDPSAVGQSNVSVQMPLFDLGGMPFLLTSNPSYFQLPPRHKLRGGGTDSDDENDASAPFIDNFLSSFQFGPPGSSGDGGGNDTAGGSGGSGTESLLGELPGDQSDVPSDDPSDEPGSNDIGTNVPDDRGQTDRVPEPTLLLLLGPAGALLLRRRGNRT